MIKKQNPHNWTKRDAETARKIEVLAGHQGHKILADGFDSTRNTFHCFDCGVDFSLAKQKPDEKN